MGAVVLIASLGGACIEDAAGAPAREPVAAPLAVAPVADATVDASRPGTALGQRRRLTLRGRPSARAYLRFDLSHLEGRLVGATLSLYAITGRTAGYRVHELADRRWTERRLRRVSEPRPGPVVGRSGRVRSHAWTAVDVTSAIDVGRIEQFALSTVGRRTLRLASREARHSRRPVLRLLFQNPPRCADAVHITAEDTALLGSTDCADPDGDPLRHELERAPDAGRVDVAVDGRFSYVPAPGHAGSDAFVVRACDAHRTCAASIVTVSVTEVNDPPVAGADLAHLEEDGTIAVPVLANDTPGPDAETGQPLVADAITTAPSHGTASVEGERVRYRPAPDFHGLDSLAYRVCDGAASRLCATGTVTVVVAPVNDAPIARDDAATVPEDAATAIDVVGNDSAGPANESPQRLAVDRRLALAPAHGTADLITEGEAAGKLRYRPAPDFHGTDVLAYAVCDDGEPSACSEAEIAISVSPVDDPPTARDDAADVLEGGSVLVDVLGNDDPGPREAEQALLLDGVTEPPDHGTADVEGGFVRYRPAAGFSGADRFRYQSCDGAGACATATVSLTVATVDDVPVARDDGARVDEDGSVLVNVLANDDAGLGDGQQALRVTRVTEPPSRGFATVDDGGVRYVPAADTSGEDRFAYEACDEGGLCERATVTVEVAEVNDPPVATGDSAHVEEDGKVVVDVLANDAPGPAGEAGQALRVVDVEAGPGAHGTVEIVPGGLHYRPAGDFNGAARFSYRLRDDGATAGAPDPREAIGEVAIRIAAVDDAPHGSPDRALVAADGALRLDVLANDSPGPADEAGEELVLESVSAPASYGSARVSAGAIVYTAPAGYSGPDWFEYRVCDADADGRLCDTVPVSLVLRAVTPSAETEPVPTAGEAADDPAIWVNAADPAASTIIGTDKGGVDGGGGIGVYELSGRQLQFLPGGRPNNVDLRPFRVAGEEVTLVTAGERATNSVRAWRVDPATRHLVPVPLTLEPDLTLYGACMYRSLAGSVYVFLTSKSGMIEQWELLDRGDGSLASRRVERLLRLDSSVEACVADDTHGRLYVSEESAGIWRTGADADSPSTFSKVDSVGDHLSPPVEGLAIADHGGGTGYLLASSQGSDRYAVYRREGGNAYVRSFAVLDGADVDRASHTDGIEVSTAALGAGFPAGLLVAQDGSNDPDNQNFKLVRLDDALGSGSDVDYPPRPASCPRPYSDASPWNAPLGSDPRYDELSDFHVGALTGRLTSDATQYTYPVYEVSVATPRQTVALSGWFSEVVEGGTRLVNQRAGTAQLPLPDGAVAAAGSDAQIILLDPVTGEEWGASHLKRDASGSWTAWNAYRYSTGWSGVPPRDESDDPFFARGAGVPYLAGLVRPCEIARGRIDHALAFAYDYPTAEYVYPASKSDGNGVEPADMPEGARLQLDPSITPAELETRGCTGACLTIARALQEYGMYVIDNSGRPKVMLEYEGTARWNGAVDAGTVAPIPLQRMKLLDLP